MGENEREIYALMSNKMEVTEVLSFWKQKKKEMPHPYMLAKKILPVAATSTPSERIFSAAGLVMNSRRSRLNPTNLDKILFVHDNYKQVA